jgi:ABC-type multidrug transport system ATPase subunit
MRIVTTELGKKFHNEWVFKNLNLHFSTHQVYAFTGPNGSGKSTLLLILSGLLPFTTGNIHYYNAENQPIGSDSIFKYLSLAAPYTELIEDFTLEEHLKFHFHFKEIAPGYTIPKIISSLSLERARHKYIRQFSSGMKQRLKLGLAFYSQSELLLLDEPSSNLDVKGVAWYKEEVLKASKGKLLIICSNQPHEYDFCKNIFSLDDYKL